jgi:hypothetical protein
VVFKFWDAKRTQGQLSQVNHCCQPHSSTCLGPNAAAHSLLALENCILSAY